MILLLCNRRALAPARSNARALHVNTLAPTALPEASPGTAGENPKAHAHVTQWVNVRCGLWGGVGSCAATPAALLCGRATEVWGVAGIEKSHRLCVARAPRPATSNLLNPPCQITTSQITAGSVGVPCSVAANCVSPTRPHRTATTSCHAPKAPCRSAPVTILQAPRLRHTFSAPHSPLPISNKASPSPAQLPS
jgi:hypothetical protein